MNTDKEEIIWSPSEWIPGAIISIIATIITSRILRNEIHKRKKPDTTFTTKSLQYSSLLSMICGVLSNVSGALNEINGLCIFMHLLWSVMFGMQAILMGLYQLSRLYYCFSNTNIHSNKGYPQWVFIFMTIMGGVLLINWILLTIFGIHGLKAKCGINSKLEFYHIPPDITSFPNAILWLWIHAFSYVTWDLTTLLLYYAKIRSFSDIIKGKEEKVYKRVLSILFQIFILTIFYQLTLILTALLEVIIHIFNDILWVNHITFNIGQMVATSTVSISLYLMMEHNKLEYIKFLRIIKTLTVTCICRRCRDAIDEQLLYFDVDDGLHGQDRTNKWTMTNIDTNTHSLPGPINRERHLSPATLTVQESDL